MIKIQICWSPLPWPIPFIKHFVILLHHNNQIDRYEVFKKWKAKQTNYLLKNYFPTYDGLPILFKGDELNAHDKWDLRVDKTIEISEEQFNKLLESIRNYPYQDAYHYWPGPNSNTFVQQILNGAEIDYKLPLSAVGKNFK